MSSRHGRYVATRHAATRQLCRDMARHVATCRDTSRPLWVAYSKLKKLLTQVSLYSLTTSWVDTFGDPRVQIPPWSILLSLGCTHTMCSSFLYMWNNYRDLCCLNLFIYLLFSLCSDDIVHKPGYSVNFHYVLFIKWCWVQTPRIERILGDNKNFLHYQSNLTNCYSIPLGVMATSATAV